ncbi:MAG: sensor histidine kinase [Anaerolineae bacterium]
MTTQPDYDKLLTPIDEIITTLESVLSGAFGGLMGDQREGLKRIYALAWGLHTLFLDVVTHIGIDNIALRPYLAQKFDEHLNPLITTADNLVQGMDGPLHDEQQVGVLFIHASGELLRRYVDNLWLYSGLLHAKYTPQKRLTTPDQFLDPMHWPVTEKPIALDLHLPDGLPSLKVDLDLMRKALYQVIENALHHTDSGRVLVTASADDAMFIVRVQDSGSGIASMHHQRIFEPFFQVQRDRPGLGLGLPIALAILTLHTGQLTLKTDTSTTVFEFSIPL